MLAITKSLLSITPYDYFTDAEVAVVLGKGSTSARRYGLLKRAIAKAEILRLKRGMKTYITTSHLFLQQVFSINHHYLQANYTRFFVELT